MRTVNPYFLHQLLAPLNGLGDDDQSVRRFASLDPNSRSEVCAVIREMLAPHYNSLPNRDREASKLALAYYLSKAGVDFGRVFDSGLPPFDPPKNPRDFFVWLWGELFPGEDFEKHAEGPMREVPDIDEPNRDCGESENRES